MRVVFAGGGTSGHVNPAIATAKYIKKVNPDAEILFIGTKDHVEARLVPEAGFRIEHIDIRGFKRSLTPYNVGTVNKLLKSCRRCRRIFRDFKPDIVVGMGGYVSGPAVLAAYELKVPCLFHEQNAFAGITTKHCSRYTNGVMLTFPEAGKQLPDDVKTVVTGVPIYGDLAELDYETCRKELGFDDRPMLLSSGGSLGAKTINDAVTDYIIRHHKEDKIQIVHGTGKLFYNEVIKKLEDAGVELGGSIKVYEYINPMPKYMTASDAVICRCGSSSLAEMCAAGKPAVMIPFPHATDNHQYHNALHIADAGGALLVKDADFNCDSLEKCLDQIIFDENKRHEMSENLKKASMYDYGEKVYDYMVKTIEGCKSK